MWIARVLIGMATSVSLAVSGCGESASGLSTDGAARSDAPAGSGGSLGGRGGTATGGAGGAGGALIGGSGGNAAGDAGGGGAPDAPAAGDTPGPTGGVGGSASGPAGAGGSSTGVVASTGGIDGGQVDGSAGQTCTYDGQTHPYGVAFPSTDGCNECWCIGPTSAMCSGVVCDAGVRTVDPGQTDGSAGQTCTYNGKTYPYSATWPSTDGCHECWCMEGSPNAVCDAGPPCDGGVLRGPPCTYEGKSYPTGATFPATDGCNSCECLWMWSPGVACTLRDCSGSSVVDALPPVDATAAACVNNGKTYPLDAHFQAADSCNYCHCSADGQVTCTFRQDCLRDADVPE